MVHLLTIRRSILDYTGDIALLSTTSNHMQKKVQLLTENARKTGLQINKKKKTKVMCTNLIEHPHIKIDEDLEVVTDFTYLGSKHQC